jgi:hypothetical protein
MRRVRIEPATLGLKVRIGLPQLAAREGNGLHLDGFVIATKRS